MKTIVHILKIVGVLLVATAGLAGIILPFTSETGLRGFFTVQGWCSLVVTALGAIFVYGAQGSRRTADSIDMSGYADSNVAREIRNDASRGADLGLEFFYGGLVCSIVVFYVRAHM